MPNLPHDESSAEPADADAPFADAAFPDATHFADTVRRLIRAQRSTTVPAAEVDRARALIAEAADILGAAQHSGPYWQAGITSADDFEMLDTFQDMFSWSPAFGRDNPIAPKVEFSFDGTTLHGTAWFDSYFCGPPWDVTHGGIIALVYDDLLGATAAVAAGGGLTGRLTISYRSTTPLFEPIRIEAALTQSEGRKFTVRGTMHHGDTLLSEAEGLFIRPLADAIPELDEIEFEGAS